MKLYSIILLLMMPVLLYGQGNCNCPAGLVDMEERAGTKPNAVFQLANGKRIGMCADDDSTENDTTFASPALFDCKTKKVYKRWGDFEITKITSAEDTILVTEIGFLPLGADYTYISQPLLVDKYYYSKGQLMLKGQVSAFQKYSSTKIAQCLEDYGHLTKGNFESTVKTADKLFCAYISGSAKAEKYFVSIPKKFGPFDGDVAEQWASTWELYLSYKKTLQTKPKANNEKDRYTYAHYAGEHT